MNIPAKRQRFVDSLTDREIVQAILTKDEKVTFEYLYLKCYPLFQNAYKRYYPSSLDCKDFIDDIYLHIMSPAKDQNKPRIATFKFNSTLTYWLKIVSKTYCYDHLKKKDIFNQGMNVGNETFEDLLTTLGQEEKEEPFSLIDVINLIQKKHFRTILHCKYIQGLTSEEIASSLNISLPNYFIKLKLAKAELIKILKQEGLL